VQPGKKLQSEKEAMVEQGYEKCDTFIRKSLNGELECQPGCNEEQTLEVVLCIPDDYHQINTLSRPRFQRF
jgi:DNA-directed RNA polymerase III subunit RPC1